MPVKLPLLAERTVKEAEVARTRLVVDFEREAQQELREAQTAVTCQKGCSHCCYHPVLFTVLEGVSLFRWLSERGMWTMALRQALQEHHRKTAGLDLTIWMLSLTPCPFLKDSLCSIYEGRPFFCRTTYSIGDPYYCHPHRISDGTGLVSKAALLQEQEQVESRLLKKHRTTVFRLPLSTALLLGEKVAKGDIELEETNQHIWQQWVEGVSDG